MRGPRIILIEVRLPAVVSDRFARRPRDPIAKFDRLFLICLERKIPPNYTSLIIDISLARRRRAKFAHLDFFILGYRHVIEYRNIDCALMHVFDRDEVVALIRS